jgi:hypothetical protein
MPSPLGLFRLADDVLRGESTALRPGRTSRLSPSAAFALMIVGFGMFYGGVMGTFGGLAGYRLWQLLFSAVKVPFLIVTTFALSLPSFYVVNTLLGLRDDFRRVVRALMTTQAGLTVILTSLSPLTAFWYVSGSAYQAAILFNGAMFAVASLGAQWMLRREYLPLIRKDAKHRWMLRTWIFIYVFVGIQMAWVLRPFVGNPLAPVEFFREDSWSNAYEVVLNMIWDVIRGRGR